MTCFFCDSPVDVIWGPMVQCRHKGCAGYAPYVHPRVGLAERVRRRIDSDLTLFRLKAEREYLVQQLRRLEERDQL